MTHDEDRKNLWLELIEAGKEEEAQELRERIPGIENLAVSKEIVTFVNGLAIDFAERFVFSSKREPFIAEQFQGEPKGVRFQVTAGW